MARTRPYLMFKFGLYGGAPPLDLRGGGGGEEEPKFFNHCKNYLKRHAHTLSGDAGADLKSRSGGAHRTSTTEERSLIKDLKRSNCLPFPEEEEGGGESLNKDLRGGGGGGV
jgi:hypothetical protein